MGAGEVTQGIFRIYEQNNTYTGTLESSKDGKLVFTATDIPAGYYNFAVQAKVGDKYAVYCGAVYVAKDLTSVGEFTCRLTKVSLIPAVKVTIKDGDDEFEKYMCAKTCLTEMYVYKSIFPNKPTKAGYIFGGFKNENGDYINYIPETDCTLYVNWCEAKTITFNTMGGSSVMSAPDNYGNSTQVASITVPGNGKSLLILIPDYAPTQMEISYEYNYDEKIKLLKPKKDGVVFDGWYFDEALTQRASCNNWSIYSDIPNENITLYAKYVSGNVIKFNTNEGSEVASILVHPNYTKFHMTSQWGTSSLYKYDSGDSITSFNDPTKAGKVFGGWYMDAGCTNQTGFKHLGGNGAEVVNGEVTFYAKWVDGKLINFDTAGGSSVDAIAVKEGSAIYIRVDGDQCYVENSDYGTIASFDLPVKQGMVFAGWYEDSTYETPISNNSSLTINSDKTIYAKFADSCTISFNTVGGSTLESIAVPKGSNVRIEKYPDSNECCLSYDGMSKNFSAPTKNNCILDGFYRDSSYSQTVSYSFTVNSDTEIFVKWIAGVTITFNSKGGSPVDSVVIPSGATIRNIIKGPDDYYAPNPTYITYVSYGMNESGEHSVRTQLPTKTGCIFGGWYKDDSFTQPMLSNNGYLNLTVTENLTVYAKWIEGAELRIMSGNSLYQTLDLTKNEEIMYQYYNRTSDGQTTSGWQIGSQTKWEDVEAPSNGNKVPEGLYEDAACTQRLPTENFTITGTSKTVYIKWVDACNVKINLNGSVLSFNVPAGNLYNLYLGPGDNDQYHVTLSNYETYSYSQHWVSNFSEPSGKTLFGFYTDSTYSTKADTGNMTISGNVTYYAKYTDTCNVSYELYDGNEGSSWGTKLETIAKGSSFFLYESGNSDRLNYFNTEVDISNYYVFTPTKAGYTFGGWYLDSAFTIQVPIGTVGQNEGDMPTCASPYQVNGDITLYAKWN